MELVLSWEDFRRKKMDNVGRARIVLLIIILLLPTLYVVVSNFYGLNAAIEDVARQNIPLEDPNREVHASLLPLSIEYLVFAALFCLIVLVIYGASGLVDFSIPAIFLGTIGALFTIDNLCPAGRSPLQLLVPATTLLAANILNLVGYQTSIFSSNHPYYGEVSVLRIKDPQVQFGIAWPCAGVESLLIYTVTIILFLKKSGISWKHKAIYFVLGASVTYFINSLRIVTLYLIAIERSPNFTITDYDFQRFHNYYGSLYSIIWIISYPLIIIGSRTLWRKIRNWKAQTRNAVEIANIIEASE
jgi:thaumarchaeosortase